MRTFVNLVTLVAMSFAFSCTSSSSNLQLSETVTSSSGPFDYRYENFRGLSYDSVWNHSLALDPKLVARINKARQLQNQHSKHVRTCGSDEYRGSSVHARTRFDNLASEHASTELGLDL